MSLPAKHSQASATAKKAYATKFPMQLQGLVAPRTAEVSKHVALTNTPNNWVVSFKSPCNPKRSRKGNIKKPHPYCLYKQTSRQTRLLIARVWLTCARKATLSGSSLATPFPACQSQESLVIPIFQPSPSNNPPGQPQKLPRLIGNYPILHQY